MVDLLVIGSGSAGFAAALRAVELGASVAIVERGTVGGTCVNVGCVPSKTLIRAAESRHRAMRNPFAGIATTAEPTDLPAVIAHKRDLVESLRKAKYQDVLASHPSIRLVTGEARFAEDGQASVDGTPIPARKVLIATGSSPSIPSLPGLSEAGFLTSLELMEIDHLPKHLIVIGGGYVGLELGQAFHRLGSEVTVLARSRLLRREGPDLGDALAAYLRQEGIDIRLGVKIDGIRRQGAKIRVSISQGGEPGSVDGTDLLIATGRVANSYGLGLDQAGVVLSEQGAIVVDEAMRTSHPDIFAAGDVTGDPAFVYVAAYAGGIAAENALTGGDKRCDLTVVPRVTFTDPAIASVGLTEEAARATGREIDISKLPMTHVPRAIAARDTRGFVKLIAERGTGHLLGAQILAPEAGDIIQIAAMAIRFGISREALGSMLFPYLTNAEAIKLACQTFHQDVTKLSCCAA